MKRILFSLIIFIISTPTLADTINLSKDEINYSNDVADDTGGRVCHIVLAVFSIHRPESIGFRVQVMRAKNNGALIGPILFGYSLDVGDMTYVNGKPDHILRKPIGDSAFASKTFSSIGRLYNTDYHDGGIGASTNDAATGLAFVNAFFSEEYRLSFRESGSDERRTYVVPGIVPQDVIKSFSDCIDTLK